MEDERIELSISGCKPDVFPLALIPRKQLERDRRIELLTLDWKSKVIPFYESRFETLVRLGGLEPPRPKATDFKSVMATNYITVA